MRVFYVKDKDGRVIHTSCVIPKCVKFLFLEKNEYEIGPCYTDPNHRRKGIYCCVLNYITSHSALKASKFYMIVHEDNLASIKGIEKAGFKRTGVVEKTKVLKLYRKK